MEANEKTELANAGDDGENGLIELPSNDVHIHIHDNDDGNHATTTTNSNETPHHGRSFSKIDPAVTRRKVLRRYFLLSTLAVVLSISCPDTFLWKDGSILTASLQRPYCVARLILVYTATLLFLTFKLQGSNPGYLTPQLMQYLDETEQQMDQEGKKDDTKHHDKQLSPDEETGLEINRRQQAPTQQHRERYDDNNSDNHDRLALLGAADMPQSRTRRPRCRHCPIQAPPLRSHHCKKCQEHVATFDHHCEVRVKWRNAILVINHLCFFSHLVDGCLVSDTRSLWELALERRTTHAFGCF